MSEYDPNQTPLGEESLPQTAPAAAAPTVVVPPEPPKRPHRLFWGLLGGCLVAFVVLTVITTIVAALSSDTDVQTRFVPGERVAILPVEGEISDVRDAIEQLHEYRDSHAVRAIVVRINSPGGSIVPSQELFEELRKVRKESGKPIVASLDSVAASGGYYVAVGCDRIVSNPGTLTGSIGVIAQWFNMEELVRWAKLKPQTFTSGMMKDSGSPFREMGERDRAYFQRIVTQLHDQFVRAVAAGRKGKLTHAQVAALADGRVFTGEEALRLNLVDELGDLHDAANVAARLAGIDENPRLIYPREVRRGLFDLIADTKAAESLLAKVLKANEVPFQYRWRF